jgi:hypothetical protein
LQLRPLLSKGGDVNLGQFSTRVVLHLKSERVEELLTVIRGPRDSFKVSLKELVAHMCPSLDCDVLVSEGESHPTLAHAREWYEVDVLEWSREILFADQRSNQTIDAYLTKAATFSRVINDSEGVPCGKACIGFGQIETGIGTVSGLTAARHSRVVSSYSMAYIGALAFESDGPRRDLGALVGRKIEIESWASAQAQLLAESDLNGYEKYIAAMNVAEFGGDPTPIAMILMNRRAASLATIYDELSHGEVMFALLEREIQPQMLSISTVMHRAHPAIGIGLKFDELEFAVRTLEAWNGRRAPDQFYHRIPTEKEPAQSSFLWCLSRFANSKGRNLQLDLVQDILFATYAGEASPRDKLTTGTELRGSALKVSLS